jgi:hypothetical protein
MYIREIKVRTNLGNMYLVNVYINTVNITKVNTTWFTKKNGTNCGILLFIYKIYVSIDLLVTFDLNVSNL